MKPSARIQACIDILSAERIGRVPLDALVGDYMRNRRYIGAKDRAEIAERIYAMTRAQGRIGWWLAHHQAPDTPRARVLAWLSLGEHCSPTRIADLCDGTKFAPEPLNEQETRFIAAVSGKVLDDGCVPEAVRLECPPIYEASLRGYFGDAFAAEMAALLKPATLDLRVNVFALARENAQNSLAKDGVETAPTPYSPWGLRCEAKAFLSKTKAMNKGWIEIQDEGSQLIAHVCGAAPGMQVLDYCAGGGGKTLALAAAMQRKGRIVAMDTDEKRLEKGRLRYKKAGIADIIEVRPLSDERHRKWLKRQKGTFDIVLLDVPCTGTGTWRRNPDARWRAYGPDLAALLPVQAEIMDKTASVVKEGGRLVYATCSLLPEENEAQVEAFLARHPEFELLPLEPALGLGAPFLRLTPHRHGTDGFFAAVMKRKVSQL